MRKTRTWTISLPPEMSAVAEVVATQEQRKKSELLREALRFYLSQRGIPISQGTRERVARAGELADISRSMPIYAAARREGSAREIPRNSETA